MPRDYYEVLGVHKGSSEQEIKSSYRKLALKFHPDRNPGDKQAEERFKEAAEAYGVLGDPDKRRRYDTYGHAGLGAAASAGFDPTVFADFSDILGEFFGFGDVFGRRRGGPRRGSDLRYNLDLSFEEAVLGTRATLQIPRVATCASCSGSGAAPGSQPTTCSTCGGAGQVAFQQGFFHVSRPCGRCRGAGRIIAHRCKDCSGEGRTVTQHKREIEIPAGVDTGSQLRIEGEGEAGQAGGPHGDLYVVLRVAEHEFFKREGTALYCEIPISLTQAALGAHIEVPTLKGEPAKLHVPEGTQHGDVLRVRGQGVPNLGGKGRGDLHVGMRVVVPRKLTAEQRKLLEQLARTLPEPEAGEREKSFFGKLKDVLS